MLSKAQIIAKRDDADRRVKENLEKAKIASSETIDLLYQKEADVAAQELAIYNLVLNGEGDVLAGTKINSAGLMRCCTASLVSYLGMNDSEPAKDGMTFNCQYCKTPMILLDNTWTWNYKEESLAKVG